MVINSNPFIREEAVRTHPRLGDYVLTIRERSKDPSGYLGPWQEKFTWATREAAKRTVKMKGRSERAPAMNLIVSALMLGDEWPDSES